MSADIAAFEVEEPDDVATALETYRDGVADFADAMNAAAARNAGCTTLCTFDRRAARQSGGTLAG